MRILAVRGKNLASLADEFEIDFNSGALSEAGLIAIAGPTGAGKSTILDTMCLALFHRLPRQDGYTNKSSVGRDGETLTVTDPRNLMRKGTSKCYAEVDFIGVDGNTYRAHWRAWRGSRGARTLQKPRAELRRLDEDEVIAGSPSEVSNTLPDVLGLNFDQFRRSVLLAQGDFAALLRTSPTERAALLESITGTDVYSEVGRLAHRKAKEVKDVIQEFTLRRDAIDMLSGEERTKIESRLMMLESELLSARQRLEDLRAENGWHANGGKLAQRVTDAESKLASASNAREDADEAATLLALVESAEELRAAYELSTTRLQEFQRAQEAVSEGEVRVGQVEDVLDNARETESEARVRRDEFEAEYELAGHEIDSAQDLDTLISASRSALEELVRDRDSRVAELETADAELKQNQQDLDEYAETIESNTAWLSDNGSSVSLEKGWSLVSDKLGDISSVIEGAPDVQALVLKSISDGEKLGLADIASFKNEADVTVTDLEAALNAAITNCKQFDFDSIEAGLKENRTRRGALLALKNLAESILKNAAAESRERKLVSSKQAEAKSADRKVTALKLQIADNQTRFDEARLAEARHEKVLSLEDQRSKLVDGEPCPLCRSEHHPYTSELPPTENPFATRVAELETDAKSLGDDLRVNERELAAANSSANDADTRADEIACESASLLTEWHQADGRSVLKAQPTEDLVLEEIATALAEVDSSVDDLEARRKEAEESHAERERLRELLADQKAKLDCVEQLVESMERIQPLVEDIESWVHAVITDPTAFLKRCEATVQNCRDAIEAKSAAVEARSTLAPVVSGLETKVSGLREEVRRLDAKITEKKATVNEHEQERGALLGGSTVDAFRKAMEQAKKVKREEHESASNALSAARESLATEQARLDESHKALLAAERARKIATKSLHDALSERQLGEGELIERLSYGKEWIDRTQTELHELDQAVHDAKRELKSRALDLKHHNEERAPEYDATKCAEELSLLEKLRDAKSTEQTKLQLQLQSDDESTQQRSELQTQIDDATKEGRVWLQLDDLLGCAQGARLRNMVQGLTFEVLLSLANNRLRELRPQYSLERVPIRAGKERDEMELQIVDHFAADDVRPVSSLSGGETFLVSIALALALSSISSQNIRIDSLFIDEGFGTLDAETLNTAMSALEQLSASDKQVTIISHVEGLRERVDACIDVIPRGPGQSVIRISADENTMV